MKDLTVFILTHNRGDLLLDTIHSVLNQDCTDFKIIVSDNSSNDETKALLEEKGLISKLVYRKRDKEYPAFDHFNICINEVDTEFFILFHDDDIMNQNMVSVLYSYIHKSDFVCVGPNSNILLGNKKTKIKTLNFFKNKILTSSDELIFQYCKNEIAVFPGYIYSKPKLKGKQFISDVGKYSDVTWLVRLINDFPFLWIKESLMYYRVHQGQDSQVSDLNSQFRLVRKWKKESLSEKTLKKVKKYQINLLYTRDCEMKECKNVSIYMRYSFFRLFPKVVVKKLLKVF